MPLVKFDTVGDVGYDRDLSASVASVGMLVEVPAGQDPTQELGVPQPGTPHPFDANLKLDRIGVREFVSRGGGVDLYRLVGLYSTNGRFRMPETRPPPVVGDKEWSITYRYVPMKIPAYQRVARYTASNDGLEVLAGYEYKEFDFTRTVKYAIYQRTVVVPELTLEQFTIINGQIDRMHIFGGQKWVMEPPDMRTLSDGKVQITYNWSADPGTPPIADPSFSDLIVRLPNIPRPPFFAYSVDLGESVSDIPIIEVFDQYPTSSPYFQPNGFEVLPGAPIE